MGQPVKLADKLILDARLMGKLGHRSIAGQIEFWALLGEALEPLLQGTQVWALLRSGETQPLSECLALPGTAKGERRVAQYLAGRPFPHFEPAPGRAGRLVRIEENGKRTIGRFIRRRFVPDP